MPEARSSLDDMGKGSSGRPPGSRGGDLTAGETESRRVGGAGMGPSPSSHCGVCRPEQESGRRARDG